MKKRKHRFVVGHRPDQNVIYGLHYFKTGTRDLHTRDYCYPMTKRQAEKAEKALKKMDDGAAIYELVEVK